MKTNKKAQEEMIGFVLIIVLVVVFAVIFLGISLRNRDSGKVQQSEELTSFVSSLVQVTTTCQKSNLYYQTIGQLVQMCYRNEECSNGERACESLAQTIKEVIDKSTYVVTKDGRISYYKLQIYSGEEENLIPLFEPISEVAEGQEIKICKGSKIVGENTFISEESSQNIAVSLEVCYKSL